VTTEIRWYTDEVDMGQRRPAVLLDGIDPLPGENSRDYQRRAERIVLERSLSPR
jgi:hypothetical protein